jgi:hypothetical protein
VVRFELTAETFALLRQARTMLDDEHGTNLADDAFVAALCSAVLDGAPTAEPTGRAKFQVAVTVCERCGQGWQEGAGAQIPIDAAAVDRAMCDAQHIGSIDGAAPVRAYQDIPPSVVRFVWRRDGGRCRTPGCRSARGLEVHHIVHRADGGGNDPSGLVLLCSACHRSHHAGVLTISGTADRLEVRRPAQAAPGSAHDPRAGRTTNADSLGGVDMTTSTASGSVHHTTHATPSTAHTRAHVDAASKLDVVILRTQAKAALTGLGWKPAIAHAAVGAAAAAQGADVTLEKLILESLRQCPIPKA